MTETAEDDLDAAVAERITIALIRHRPRMRQVDLARKLSVSESWVSLRQSGHYSWTVRDLRRISEILGIHVLDLLPDRESVITRRYYAPFDQTIGAAFDEHHTRPSGLDARPPSRHESARPPIATRPVALLRSVAAR